MFWALKDVSFRVPARWGARRIGWPGLRQEHPARHPRRTVVSNRGAGAGARSGGAAAVGAREGAGPDGQGNLRLRAGARVPPARARAASDQAAQGRDRGDGRTIVDRGGGARAGGDAPAQRRHGRRRLDQRDSARGLPILDEAFMAQIVERIPGAAAHAAARSCSPPGARSSWPGSATRRSCCTRARSSSAAVRRTWCSATGPDQVAATRGPRTGAPRAGRASGGIAPSRHLSDGRKLRVPPRGARVQRRQP